MRAGARLGEIPKMRICTLRNFSTLVSAGVPVCLAIGIFDGFHRGHAEIFSRAAKFARQRGGIFGALTFDPHPDVLFRGTAATKLIYPLESRLEKFAEFGADFAVSEPFTREFAGIRAEQFAAILKEKIPELAAIHIGENFKFGAGRGGNAKVLHESAERLGIVVDAAPAVEWQGAKISSTRVRECLERGDIRAANAMLFKNYEAAGKIRGGHRLGRTIGFPTLNLPWNPELAPRFGVYAVRLWWKRVAPATVVATNAAGLWRDGGGEISFKGVANFGVRPTVESGIVAPKLETFLLVGDDDKALPTTGDEIRVEWLEFLRAEQRFDSLEKLRQQLATDKVAALKFFAAQ